jgi:hypothetical protein
MLNYSRFDGYAKGMLKLVHFVKQAPGNQNQEGNKGIKDSYEVPNNFTS